MEILSPVNGATATGTTIQVVVRFSAKLNPQGQPSGNVKRVELKVNGVVVASYQNPPSVKTGTVTFVVDLTPYGTSTITLQAFAFQGSGGSAAMGTSTATALILGSPDQTPPTISNPTPAPGALRSQADVEIRADLADAGSGVDAAATRLFLNASEVTSGVTRTSSSVSHAASGLTEGVQRVRVVAADVRGNPAEREWEFGVDLTDPFVAFTEPGAGAIVGTGRPIVRFEFFDPAPGGFGAGIDTAAGVRLTEDGRDVSAELSFAGDIATYQPPADRPLSQGPHMYEARVEDRSGRSAQAERSIGVNLEPPQVAILSPAPGTTTNYAPTFSFLFDGPSGALPAFARINGVDVLSLFEIQFGFLARYEPVLGDLVFLVPGVNVFEVGVVDGFGRVGTASVEIFLDRTSAPATVVPVIELREGGDQQVISRRCSGDIVVVTRVGPEGRTVGDVRIEVGAPHGLILPGEVFGFVSNPDGNAGFHYQPEATTGLVDVEAVSLSVSAPDFPDAEPLLVPVSVYFPQSIEVEVVRPFVAPDATFDATVLVGSSSPIVFARLTDPRGGQVGTVLRHEIGRIVAGEFVEDASLGEWVPREAQSSDFHPTGFSSDARSALFAMVATPAGEDPYTVRISAPEYPEVAARTYPVRFEAATTFRRVVSTPGGDPVTSDLPIGSIFQSGNAAVTAVGGSPGTVVLNLAPLRAALKSALPDEPASFGIRFVLSDTVFVLSDAPGTSVGDVDEWPFEVPPGGGDVKFILVDVVGSSRDPITGTEASVSFRDLGSRGVPEVRFVKQQSDGSFKPTSFVPVGPVFNPDWTLAPREPDDEYYVEMLGPVLAGPAISRTIGLTQLELCGKEAPSRPRQVGTANALLAAAEVERTDRFIRYRSVAVLNTQERFPPDLILPVPEDRVILHGQVRGATRATIPDSSIIVEAVNSGTTFVDRFGRELEVVSAFLPNNGVGATTPPPSDAAPIPGFVLRLPSPLSPSLVDLLEVDVSQTSIGFNSLTLVEDAPASGRFVSTNGTVVFRLTSEPEDIPAEVDRAEGELSYEVHQDLIDSVLPVTAITLIETGLNTRVFSSILVPLSIDLPPADPSPFVFRILRVTPEDKAEEPATVATPVESVDIVLSRIGPHQLLSRDLLTIPEGSDAGALPPGLELTVIRTRSAGTSVLNLTVTGSGDKTENPPLGALAFYAVNPGKAGAKEALLVQQAVRPILSGKLGIPVTIDTQLNRAVALALMRKHSVWYCGAEGYLPEELAVPPDSHGPFKGFILRTLSGDPKLDAIVTPADLPAGLSYELVFMDVCKSAENMTPGQTNPDGSEKYTEGPVVREFIDRFNTKVWLGWKTVVPSVRIMRSDRYAAVTTGFFNRLDGGTSVQAAFDGDNGVKKDDLLDPVARQRLHLLVKTGAPAGFAGTVVIDRTP